MAIISGRAATEAQNRAKTYLLTIKPGMAVWRDSCCSADIITLQSFAGVFVRIMFLTLAFSYAIFLACVIFFTCCYVDKRGAFLRGNRENDEKSEKWQNGGGRGAMLTVSSSDGLTLVARRAAHALRLLSLVPCIF